MLRTWFRVWRVRQEGQGMTEYGLILALIAVVLITVLTDVGQGLLQKFREICTALGC